MASPNVDDNPIVQSLLTSGRAPAPKDAGVENEWRSRATKFTSLNLKELEGPLAELDSHLTLRSHISGYKLTTADLIVWGILRSNRIAHSYLKQGLRVCLSRWFNYIEESNAWIADAASSTTTSQRPSATTKDDTSMTTADDGGNYDIGLQDTSKGVVTRFPPEPSGFLHIGHAKAALLNDYFAHKRYRGTLILRFDDTNPAKESQEFENSIVEDLAMMGITPDKTTHTSDYFNELHDYCVQMLREGNAYADDTDKVTLAKQRMDGIPSARRDISPAEGLAKFEEMKKGTEEGKQWFIRAKISPDDPNKALRDPVIYRCSPQPHHRTGNAWKVYPTYDFCCPVVDSLEGVTHALRTTEYKDRDAQYQWMIQALKVRGVYNWDFSRMNFVRTLLSKRKLTKFVQDGVVRGWDDPRMPTVRGIRRRGCTVPALQEFILKQGPSKNIVNLDWTSFWAINKKYIDPISARYTAITTTAAVPTTLLSYPTSQPATTTVPLHAKHDLGTKTVVHSPRLLLEQSDAATLTPGEEITLMNWGNAIVRHIAHSALGLSKTVSSLELELNLDGDVKKTAKKVTWLADRSAQDLVPCELVEFDFLITKDKLEDEDRLEDFVNPKTEVRTACVADCNVAGLRRDSVMQFDRKGYFRVDRPFVKGEGGAEQAAVMFQIPTGRTGK